MLENIKVWLIVLAVLIGLYILWGIFKIGAGVVIALGLFYVVKMLRQKK